jgi:molybdopterin-containing oxidoreductase family membrane subunit
VTEFNRDISLSGVNESVLSGLSYPQKRYFLLLFLLSLVIGWGVIMWILQVKTGMVVTGLNHPVGWGTYITNFVFWIGIAHSGTLISAILFLMRSQWRDAVSRATEAMTVIAVMTAGMFPLIHLGRLWVFYYILPYPNQRALYPNYMSPLVWDLIAVLTYFTVSVIFFYYGIIPDAAAARDRFAAKYGIKHWRTKFFRVIALGWSGSLSQWRHYNRSYMLFALLATPLVVSVHSIVSWDFASSLLPGWHSTIFAPYFVAGAIHSGLAMSLTLLIPLRKFLNLKNIITVNHLETVAKVIIITMSILAYTYIIEPSIEFHTGDKFIVQFSKWRATGSLSWVYYVSVLFNIFVPVTFFFKKIRRKVKWLFVASLLINIGMWLERYLIVTGSTSHDFMPHNWGSYAPTFVELSISAGLAAFFLFMYLVFSKLLPAVTVADFKDFLVKEKLPQFEPCNVRQKKQYFNKPEFRKVMYVFSSPGPLLKGLKYACEDGFRNIEVFSPMKLKEAEVILKVNKSPVGFWTLVGGVAGLFGAAWLEIGSVSIYDIVVGGKHAVSIIPYLPIMFELTILGAALANLVAVLWYTKLYKRKINPYYDPRFSTDKFGMLITYDRSFEKDISDLSEKINPDEITFK